MVYEAGSTNIFQAVETLQRRMVQEMTNRMGARVPGLRGSHGRLLHFIDAGGSRPSEIAERASVTRQAVGQRLKEMEDKGLVRTTSDPTDGRSIRVHRTAKGQRVVEEGLKAMATIEDAFAEEVGQDDYVVLRRSLNRLGEG